jgi:hypothetical protein
MRDRCDEAIQLLSMAKKDGLLRFARNDVESWVVNSTLAIRRDQVRPLRVIARSAATKQSSFFCEGKERWIASLRSQ